MKTFIANTAEPTEERSQKELECIELETLLPEMFLKIEDSSEQMENAIEAMKKESEQEMTDQVAAARIKDSPTKPVNDISHLLKRKRPETDETGSKKLCAGDAPKP